MAFLVKKVIKINFCGMIGTLDTDFLGLAVQNGF